MGFERIQYSIEWNKNWCPRCAFSVKEAIEKALQRWKPGTDMTFECERCHQIILATATNIIRYDLTGVDSHRRNVPNPFNFQG